MLDEKTKKTEMFGPKIKLQKMSIYPVFLFCQYRRLSPCFSIFIFGHDLFQYIRYKRVCVCARVLVIYYEFYVSYKQIRTTCA